MTMQAATLPRQRPPDARLLVVHADGRIEHHRRAELADALRPGDLLVANDAATIPASLAGTHERSGAPIEVRLAGRRSLAVDDVHRFTAIVFGAGDHRTRTEDRAAPPDMQPGDMLLLGPSVAPGRPKPLTAPSGGSERSERGGPSVAPGRPKPLTAPSGGSERSERGGPLHGEVVKRCGHPRLIELRFDGSADAIWAGIARHGKPIQYAHTREPLALWDVWTRVAALPVAFEPPSAGFVLDWQLLDALLARGIGFATLTHAAGISSTGDAALDALLPFDEPYLIPAATVRAITATHARGGRVVALGTTVTRALEHAAGHPAGLRPGAGVATQRIGATSTLRVVDAIVSGTHEPGTSHYELLRAFADAGTLERADAELQREAYLTHEFGESVLIERGIAISKPVRQVDRDDITCLLADALAQPGREGELVPAVAERHERAFEGLSVDRAPDFHQTARAEVLS
jgi:S-adenosylmethionine:tRNA ribosyltransferase-isomerase